MHFTLGKVMSNYKIFPPNLFIQGVKRNTQGAVNPVIQRASSLVFETLEEKKHATQNRYKGALFYGRRGTLTHFHYKKRCVN